MYLKILMYKFMKGENTSPKWKKQKVKSNNKDSNWSRAKSTLGKNFKSNSVSELIDKREQIEF